MTLQATTTARPVDIPIQTQAIAWDKIYIPKKPYKTTYPDTSSTLPDSIGFDTETYKGYAKIICDSKGRTLRIKQHDYKPLLNYLLSSEYKDTFNTFYNLKYDVSAIIKHLPKTKFEELVKTNETKVQGFTLKYLQSKFFGISKRGLSVTFYDIAQFFHLKLAEAAKIYLPTTRKDTHGLDASKMNIDIKYWRKHEKTIIKYCIQDSVV